LLVERQANPYRPGFNQAPTVLAGRGDVLDAAREALEVAAIDGRTPRPLVVVGSRGLGKTVLLGEIGEIAATEHGWPTVYVEVRPDVVFTAQLIERVEAVTEALRDPARDRRFMVQTFSGKAAVAGVGAEISVVRRNQPGAPNDLGLERALLAACTAATERGTGVVVAIDETQAARRRDLGELAAVLQQHVPDNWPLVVVVAGLPSVRDVERSVTYLERGEWHELGMLERADTLLALTGPAQAAGRPLDTAAAGILADASGGYPYAVQVMGHHAWRASHGAARVTVRHATDALPRAERDLAAGLYAGRWEGASPKERDYLRAVASFLESGDKATSGAVAARLGSTTRDLSYLRDRLLKKGTLVASGGELTFPVPGMAAWVAGRS
jgi:hypothetical protein